jgi:predicted O-linked N-acetylglucosamine transferase (SPINDLY family)
LYLNYHPDLLEKTLFEAHENWAATHQKYPEKGKVKKVRQFHSRIRIGFVSADFCRHPVSYFLLPILRNLSSELFQISCYSNKLAEDDLTTVIKQCCHRWRNIKHLNDTQLVECIKNDSIDILFDLSGHTSGNRLTAFSHKPAPVQISWLAYPHTTGLEAMDYVLSDATSLPDYLHWQFTEKVVHLNAVRCCYEPPTYAPTITPLPALKNKHITFGCFNNPVKLNKKTIALWSKILQHCKNSKLVLSWKTLNDHSVRDNILRQFELFSVSPARLILLGGARSHEQVLLDYTNIDIALDTYPFSGGLTSCEALWMGLPVITLAGKRPVTRQTAGLLAAIGLDKFIHFSPDDYVQCAIALAHDLETCAKIRESLRSRMLSSALCDDEKFTANFEHTIAELFFQHEQENSGSTSLN